MQPETLREAADTRAIETVARWFHALLAAFVTFGIAKMFGLDDRTAHEAMLVNGGLAYFTDDVAGRVVDALNRATRALRPQQPAGVDESRYDEWLKSHADHL